jgi:hypothetical protein
VSAPRRAELVLVAGLVGALGLAVWAGRHAAAHGPDNDLRASSFGAGPEGSRGPFDVLARLGWMVERRRRPLLELDGEPQPAVLLLLAPVIPLLPAELVQAARFIRKGGAVVAAGEAGGLAECAQWTPLHGPGLLAEADTIEVRAPRASLRLPRVSDVLERTAEGRNASSACRSLAPAREDTLLATPDGRPVAVKLWFPSGGSLTLWADATYFRNRTCRTGDVPYFVAPLMVPPRGTGPIAWDEYHQGFGAEASVTTATWAWLATSPGGWALLQLTGVALLALAGAAVRFGPAQTVVERRRRSPLEHVEALAAGLEGASGTDVAVRLAVGGLRRRLARAGTSMTSGDAEWLAALERAAPTAGGRDAVRRLALSVREPGGHERVLVAAQAVEDVWEELRPRTKPGTS